MRHYCGPARFAFAVFLVSALGRRALADEASGVTASTLSDVWVTTTKEAPLPSEPLLGTGSPASVVSAQPTEQVVSVSVVGDYGTLADLTPSFVSSAPNGPGFDAAKNESLRGFVVDRST
jgi:iron complex outermembrane recepter protein